MLISPDFIVSDYCFSVEMKRAIERHERGEAYVIPIILRSVYCKQAPFVKLQALPTDAKPVTSWSNIDEAFFDIAEGIRLVCEELLQKSKIPSISEGPGISRSRPLQTYTLYEVFVKSGVPKITFVVREDYGRLKLALAQPGR